MSNKANDNLELNVPGGEPGTDTGLIHTGHELDPYTGAASIPIYQVSTFAQPSLDEFGRWDYARSGNPTRNALEQTVAELEGGVRACAFASGMAAITASLMLLNSGDHVIVTRDCYGGTHRLFTQVLNRFGLKHTFVDTSNLDEVRRAWQDNTKAVYVETLSNPLLAVSDIAALADLAHARKALLFVDNTMLSPVLQQPLQQGADLVLHSATKYMAGHSDLMAGVAAVRDEELGRRLYFLQNAMGNILGPFDSWLLLRGMKTLGVRMRKQAETANRLAHWLAERPEVERVYYPGLTTHAGHEVAKRQATGYGALFSFRLHKEYNSQRFIENVKLAIIGVSLGSVESIISLPMKQSHAAVPADEREQRGIDEQLIRFSVGLEDYQDLQADFERALQNCKKV